MMPPTFKMFEYRVLILIYCRPHNLSVNLNSDATKRLVIVIEVALQYVPLCIYFYLLQLL
jgi:hypothetical protein